MTLPPASPGLANNPRPWRLGLQQHTTVPMEEISGGLGGAIFDVRLTPQFGLQGDMGPAWTHAFWEEAEMEGIKASLARQAPSIPTSIRCSCKIREERNTTTNRMDPFQEQCSQACSCSLYSKRPFQQGGRHGEPSYLEVI
mmetsp:Transcript_4666/g.16563  ORF Transcript_4666/g.16563 Transcript_4666/m.16563 type:complete len:141 (-) Transcript_4666:2683-3105(-)